MQAAVNHLGCSEAFQEFPHKMKNKNRLKEVNASHRIDQAIFFYLIQVFWNVQNKSVYLYWMHCFGKKCQCVSSASWPEYWFNFFSRKFYIIYIDRLNWVQFERKSIHKLLTQRLFHKLTEIDESTPIQSTVIK